jgi:DNA-binding GntR family transcriptional regulator
MNQQKTNQLAERVYGAIKSEIFDFRLLPGDRFTETELARRLGVSRTPVRDALYRLKRDGYLDVVFRSGWRVNPFDFSRFDELYEFRILIECASVERLCAAPLPLALAELAEALAAAASRGECDPRELARLDELFHTTLVDSAGNSEMARTHAQITEKIRIVRRLDFAQTDRVETFYRDHPAILDLIRRRRGAEALTMLRAHITQSKEEVRKITLHMLYEARRQAEPLQAAQSSAAASPSIA